MLARHFLKLCSIRAVFCRQYCDASGAVISSNLSKEQMGQSPNIERNLNEKLESQISNNPLQSDKSFECVVPIVTPSFNLAAYVNKSEVLQEMVKLGVAIYKWDKMPDVQEMVLKKNFNTDIKPIITFLVDVGVEPDNLGMFLTRNPKILNESLENLQARHNFLVYKKFNGDEISRIYTRNPSWLTFKTSEIESRLKFFQQVYHLSDIEVRQLATGEPRLVTSQLERVKEMNFGFLEEMGFDNDEVKSLILTKPKLWIMNKSILVERFDYLHNVIKMDHSTIVTFPTVLTCRNFRIRQRHEFLRFLNRDQYDPTRPNYVSPLDLVSGADTHFASHVAKSSVLQFNDFCKTL